MKQNICKIYKKLLTVSKFHSILWMSFDAWRARRSAAG
jgi:hypothetical protein